MPALTIAELSTAVPAGAGVFDVLMRAVKAHLEQEFAQARIKGPEYSTVYLGSVELAMQTGLTFLLNKDKQDLESQLLQAQIELANVQVEKAQVELEILQKTVLLKIPAEIEHLEAQTAMLVQQKLNAVTAGANAVIEGANLTKQGEMLVTQKAHVGQQTTNLVAEALNIPKQGLVLDGTKCKLDAEFTHLQKQTEKVEEEKLLLAQKTATEKAQTQTFGVDDNSVIGKQKGLYQAQTDGFKRDAEQKVAKLFTDVWSVQRTTDEAIQPGPAGLGNTEIAAVLAKLRTGIGA